MSSLSPRIRRVGILGILALVAAAAACGGDSAPEPSATGTPTPEPTVTEAPATTTPEPTVTEAPATTTTPEPPAAGEFDIDVDTTLREVFNAFADSEQACVRDALGDDQLEPMLDMLVLSDDGIDQSIAEIISCLDTETAREFFLSATMAALIGGAEEEGLRTDIGVDEWACLQERLAGVDVASVVDVLVSETTDPALLSLLGCIPDLLVQLIMADAGVALDELTEQQRSCLSDLVADTDWTALVVEAESIEAESEGFELFAFSFGLFACVPEFLSADSAADPSPVPREDVADDHADSGEQATPVATGDAAAGEIQYETDVDYFVFEAEPGRLYQIDVTLGTLPDSVATLYDSDGIWLEDNDDHADTTASRIYWEAQASGSLYVAVEGWSGDTGTYTLTIVTPTPTPAAIIIDGPTIVSTPSTDSDGDGVMDTYVPSDVIEVRIRVSEQSCGYGTLALTFQTGDGPSEVRSAQYGGCGSDAVYFEYEVNSGDLDGDGVSIAANSISLTTYDGTVRNTAHPAVPPSPYHRVNGNLADTRSPQLSYAPGIGNMPLDGTTFRAGEVILIEATFDEQVIVDTAGGLPTIELEVGDEARTAAYQGGDEDSLLFGYIVRAGDWDIDGEIWVIAGSITIPAGTFITDLAGNDADIDWVVSSGAHFMIDGGDSPSAMDGA